MLDPRSLEERRDEIAESCRKRGVVADVDGAVEAQRRQSALQGELNEANRQRNAHQAAGKKKLEPDEREAHTAEGRRLKEVVAGIEEQLGTVRETLEERIRALPNFVHRAAAKPISASCVGWGNRAASTSRRSITSISGSNSGCSTSSRARR
jgi:seryl-tRNA synthetase